MKSCRFTIMIACGTKMENKESYMETWWNMGIELQNP